MATIINKKTKKELTQRKLEQYERYNTIIQWGRSHPIEFSERFMGFDYLDIQRYVIYNTWFSDFVLWLLCRNGSKALPIDTKIATYDGLKSMFDIHIGDYVLNEQGFSVKVINESEIMIGQPCYEIYFDDGSKIITSSEHLWTVKPKNTNNLDEYGCITLPTYKIKQNYCCNGEYQYEIPMSLPIIHDYKNFRIHPYTMGVLIGESKYINDIPQRDKYLTSNVSQRFSLLEGMMDTIGIVNNEGTCSFLHKSKAVRELFKQLLSSLGIKYKVYAKNIEFYSSKTNSCFKIKEKFDKLPHDLDEKHKWRTIVDVKSVKSVPVKCIAVDSPRQLFLCGENNIVTHNTTMAAMYTMVRSILLPKHISYFIGNTGDQAKEVFKKVEKIAKHEISSFVGGTDIFYNELIKNGATSDGFTHAASSFNATLFNGSEINTLNSDIINIKGKRANMVFFDEAGWMSDELFVQAGHFTDQNENFKLGDKINLSIQPKEFPRQLIYASSASDRSSEYYKKFKSFSRAMMMGDRKYFACNFTIDSIKAAKHLGQPFPSLISQSKIDEAMENPEKAARELFNKFSDDSYEGQIVDRRELIKHTTNNPPVLRNIGDKQYIIAWDSARLNDNSIVAIAEIYQDEQGYKMKIVNVVSFVDIKTKKKTPMIIPDQIEAFKKILLDYNGSEYGKLDYENIPAIICDSGAGGQMVSISDYLLNDWNGADGKEHRGLIDREHKANETTKTRFPDAVDIVKLVDPKAHRNAIFDAAERMTKLGVVSFPAEYDNKDAIISIKDDGTEDIYELSVEEQISLAQITRMKDEIVLMCKNVSGGNVSYNFPADKRNTTHDDRVFVYGLLCWHLANLRKGQIRERPKTDNNEVSELFKLYRAPKIG